MALIDGNPDNMRDRPAAGRRERRQQPFECQGIPVTEVEAQQLMRRLTLASAAPIGFGDARFILGDVLITQWVTELVDQSPPDLDETHRRAPGFDDGNG